MTDQKPPATPAQPAAAPTPAPGSVVGIATDEAGAY